MDEMVDFSGSLAIVVMRETMKRVRYTSLG